MLDDLNSSKGEQEALLKERFDKERKRYEALLYDLDVRRKDADNERDKALHALQKERRAADEYREKVEGYEAQRQRLERDKGIQRSQLELLRHEPAKLELNLSMLAKLEREVEEEDAQAAAVVQEKEARVATVLKERKALTTQLDEVGQTIETYRLNIAKRKSNIDEMTGERELEKGKNARLLDTYHDLNQHRVEVREATLRVQAEVTDLTKGVEGLKKGYEKVRRKKETIVSIVRPLQAQIGEKQAELKRLEEVTAKLQAEQTAVHRGNEALIAQLLSTEDRDAEWEGQLSAVNEDIREAEEAIAAVEAREAAVEGGIKDLEVHRSTLTSALSRQQREAHRLREALGLNVMAAKESAKVVEELVRTIRLCGDKYEVLKGQKGQLVGLVTDMEGKLGEVVERAKMLDAEMVVLKGEMAEKERAQRAVEAQVKEVKARAEKLRVEENKRRAALRVATDRELELTLEVAQLQDVLRGIELGMEGMKARYVHAVTSRNGVGLALIDRNDELCLLYEQSEVMQRMLQAYEEDIGGEEEACVAIVRDTEDVKRRVEVARRQIPSAKTWEGEVHARDALLLRLGEERGEVERLSMVLETPPTGDALVPSRARVLGGEDADVGTLAAEVEEVEGRLGVARKGLLEVEVELKEVGGVVERLGREVAEGRGAVVRAAVEGVEERAEGRRLERQMQADVSELSMYQAMLVKGAGERERVEEEVRDMRRRLERGEAPSREAEGEWVRRQRERTRMREALTSLQRSREEEEMMATITRSTAEVRPNAYISDLGLPKPYGGLAPFKPSILGAQLRHFRIPQPKEVQL